MQEMKDFLEQKRSEYEKRAERMNEQIEMFRRTYEKNEKAHRNIPGWPRAMIPDIIARGQYNSAISKQNELYAVVNFIDKLDEKFLNQ